jgi:hypothetical protein
VRPCTHCLRLLDRRLLENQLRRPHFSEDDYQEKCE